MKRKLSILMVLLLVTSSTLISAGAEDILHGYQSSWHNYGLERDPITLTICVGAQDIPNSGLIDSIENQLITQATGITLDWIQTDTEKFAVLAAGGDLPDLISPEETKFLPDLISMGMLVDMAPLLPEYGLNILKLCEGYPLTYAKEMYGNGESVYYIPTYIKILGDYKVASYNGSFGHYLRFDIYQAIGMPDVSDEAGFNEDLFIDVLKQMQDYVREQLQSDTVYALSGYNSWGVDWIVRHPYNFGISARCGDSAYDQISGDLLPSITDKESAWWDMIRFYNKAYLAGIYDPEAFTMTWDQYADKLDNNEVLVSVSPRSPSTQMIEQFGNTAGFFCVKGMPYFSGLVTLEDPRGYGIFSSDSININCKYPERAMALIDYLRSDEFMRTAANGLQGIDWDYGSDGVPAYINDALAAYKSNNMNEYWQMGGSHYKQFPLYKWGISLKICDDGYPSDFLQGPDAIAERVNIDIPAQNFLAAYDAAECRYPGELYAKWVEEGIAGINTGFNALQQFVPITPDEEVQQDTKIRTYIKDNWARMIFAESPEQCQVVIDEVRMECENMGIEELYLKSLERIKESEEIAKSLGF